MSASGVGAAAAAAASAAAAAAGGAGGVGGIATASTGAGIAGDWKTLEAWKAEGVDIDGRCPEYRLAAECATDRCRSM